MKQCRWLLLFLTIFLGPALASSILLTCPPAQELKLGPRQRWGAYTDIKDPDSGDSNKLMHFHWVSTDPALSTKVNEFVGAQFIGNTEGHIVCLYLPAVTNGTHTFPIILHFQTWPTVHMAQAGLQTKGTTAPSTASIMIRPTVSIPPTAHR